MRVFSLLLILLTFVLPACASPNLEQEIGRLFIGHSFNVRNFYRGAHLRYGSDGQVLDKAEPGYWSRDSMVEISSVKLSRDNELIMQGERTCILFDAVHGEFSNVRTGERVQIVVQLRPDQLSFEAVIPVLQRVFLTSKERLSDLIPLYWRDCFAQKVNRRDKHSPWECAVSDQKRVPDFAGKKVSWDIPAPDTNLHNGTQLYTLRHRVAYLSEAGVTDPRLQVAPDPLFQWEQRRTVLDAMTLVLALTVGEDGRAHDISIVSPIGMGLDDEAVEAVAQWKFSPGVRDGKPCAVHARVFFDITAPNARPALPLQ